MSDDIGGTVDLDQVNPNVPQDSFLAKLQAVRILGVASPLVSTVTIACHDLGILWRGPPLCALRSTLPHCHTTPNCFSPDVCLSIVPQIHAERASTLATVADLREKLAAAAVVARSSSIDDPVDPNNPRPGTQRVASTLSLFETRGCVVSVKSREGANISVISLLSCRQLLIRRTLLSGCGDIGKSVPR